MPRSTVEVSQKQTWLQRLLRRKPKKELIALIECDGPPLLVSGCGRTVSLDLQTGTITKNYTNEH